MRGGEERQAGFIVMTTLEDVVPEDHPLRAIRVMVDAALEEMSPALEALYAARGRPSIAPEYLLRAQLVQILYAIPSERRLCEQLRYDLLLRWFVGLPIDEPVFHPTSFTKTRDRLLRRARRGLLPCDSRSGRGAEAAVPRALQRRRHADRGGRFAGGPAADRAGDDEDAPPRGGGRNPEVDWRGERRGKRNPPLDHRPRTPARAQGEQPGGQALLRRPQPDFENRNGLIVDCELTKANGHLRARGRPAAAGAPAPPLRAQAHERRCRPRLRHARLRGRRARPRITPHVAAKDRFSAVERPHDQACRLRHEPAPPQLVEEPFGWMKTVGGLHKLRHRGKVRRPPSSPSAAPPTIWCGLRSCWRSRLRREVEGQ